MNMAILCGRLTREGELRYTPGGSPVVNLSVATNERRGEKIFAEFHRVVVFGDWVPEAVSRWQKGVEVMVIGKIQTRAWEDKQGSKKESTEIVAKTVKVTDERRD